jgi:predicted Zn-dependent protease
VPDNRRSIAKTGEEAETLFGQVAKQAGGDADAALYWQAYAQLKRGRKSAALHTLETLTKTYPESSWIDDARALEVEARGAGSEQFLTGSDDDEQLKLYALNSLMNVDSQKALPILDEFLQGNHSLELKRSFREY